MTIHDVIQKALSVFPEASVETGMDGQLIIYTNLKVVSDDEVVSLEDGIALPDDMNTGERR